MKFESIKLTNFKQYKDEQIDFSDGVNIIEGENGFGKSTLMAAMHFALYGSESMYNTKLIPNNGELVNQENIIKNDKGKILKYIDPTVKVDMVIETDQKVKYHIVRTKTVNLYSTPDEDNLTVYRGTLDTGFVEKELKGDKKFEYLKFIPEKIAPLLFFDGERIKSVEEVLETSKKNKRFNEEIENILQIEDAEKVKNLIKQTASSVVKDSQNVELVKLQTTLEEQEAVVKELEDIIDNNNEKLRIIDKNITLWEENQSENEKNLRLDEERKIAEEKVKFFKENVNQKENTLKRMLLLNKRDKIKYEIYSEIFDKITQNEDVYEITGIEQQAVSDIITNEKCICGTPLNNDLRQNLLDVQRTLPPESFQSILAAKKANGGDIKEEELELERYVENIISDNDEIEKLNLTIQRCIEQTTDSSKLEINYSDLIEERGAINTENNLANKQINNYKYYIDETKNQLEIAYKESSKQELSNLVREKLLEAVDYMENDINNIKKIIKEKVEKNLNKHAERLIKDTVKITLNDELYPEKTEFLNESVSSSTGQGVLISISYLFALIDVATEQLSEVITANEKFPMVFDNVTATLDKNHTNNLVQNLEEYPGQVIMLANSKDIIQILANYDENKEVFVLIKEVDSKVTTIGVRDGI